MYRLFCNSNNLIMQIFRQQYLAYHNSRWPGKQIRSPKFHKCHNPNFPFTDQLRTDNSTPDNKTDPNTNPQYKY